MEIDPKMVKAYFWRGKAYCKKGQVSLGISDLNNVKKLDPNLEGIDGAISQCRGKQKKVGPRLTPR